MDAQARAQRNFKGLILHKEQLVKSATLFKFQKNVLYLNMHAHLIKHLKAECKVLYAF